ncbi:TusE/DsrC/DsvC family sulfur relay protein [Escherichia coli]
MLIYENTEIETDSEGYLKDTTLWSEGLAAAIAANEGIELSPEHWEVVRFVRAFYLEFNTSRPFVCWSKRWRTPRRRERQQPLPVSPVPKGPAKQATKIAGLPKPVKCI